MARFQVSEAGSAVSDALPQLLVDVKRWTSSSTRRPETMMPSEQNIRIWIKLEVGISAAWGADSLCRADCTKHFVCLFL